MRRRIDPERGLSVVRAYVSGRQLTKSEHVVAVRFALEEFAERHPGKSVEIRIPWIGAVQAIAGPAHKRGTPPNVVEMDGDTWLALVVGKPSAGVMRASGSRADLSPHFPLFGPAQLAQRD